MTIKPIAYSYWRRIKAGARSFDSVPDSIKPDILELAKQDLDNFVITEEEYNDYIIK